MKAQPIFFVFYISICFFQMFHIPRFYILADKMGE